jgi:DNA-binding MarR family transcriptional regulator
MKMSELDKQLQEFYQQKHKSWGKLISMLKRQFDHWATAELAENGYEDFKMGYMPLLMNIHPEGITNTELAKKAKVSKQAMSKVVKELQEGGYIQTEIHGQDKRSAIIYLTAKGKKLVLSARGKIFNLEKEYEAVIGKKKFEELKETLEKLIDYHDQRPDGCL